MPSELDMLKARIVAVYDYFDEEREIPVNYIQRTGDGRFEAIATHLLDLGDVGEAREHSVGLFATVEEAQKALWAHLEAVRLADQEWHKEDDGRIVLDDPTIQ